MNLDSISKTLQNNAPHILTGLAIAGVVGTAVSAVAATPKALDAINGAKYDAALEERPVTKRDKFKAAWVFYIPTAVIGVGTVACIVGANSVHTRRNATLASGAALLQTAYSEYQDKTREKLGPKKEEEVRAEIAQEHLEEQVQNGVVFVEDDKTLCYDRFSGRIFYSDRESIRKAENDVVAGINYHQYASLNDFYRRIGLEDTDAGESLGFNQENPLSIEFSSTLVNNRPALAIDYHHAPIPRYHKIW